MQALGWSRMGVFNKNMRKRLQKSNVEVFGKDSPMFDGELQAKAKALCKSAVEAGLCEDEVMEHNYVCLKNEKKAARGFLKPLADALYKKLEEMVIKH